MQRAVCTLCTSFGSWSLFGLFPFKGTAYGAYNCIRLEAESGLSPTVRRHWSLFRPPKPKVHTVVHTAFGSKSPYRHPIGGTPRFRGECRPPAWLRSRWTAFAPVGRFKASSAGFPAVRRGTLRSRPPKAGKEALERRTHSMWT